MPERVAGHEHAEPDPRRLRGDRREQRPRLEAAVLGAAVGVDQVVDEPGMIEPQLLGLEELLEDLVPAHADLAQEQPEAQRGGIRHGRCSRRRYRWISTTMI